MEKLIGGCELPHPFPASIRHKLLWPCFEFIASAEGLDDYEKNIIEEAFLKLADAGVTDEAELAACTALDGDLVSFMHARLQQKGWLDSSCRITDEGRAKLALLEERRAVPVRVYVDALTGRVVPRVIPVSQAHSGEVSYEMPVMPPQTSDEATGAVLFRYRPASLSAGTERDEVESALLLHYETLVDKETGARRGAYNAVPAQEAVAAMLHRLFPKNDSLSVRLDDAQDTKKNLRWLLLDLLLPEGDTRNWVCTDGFGSLSTFFSVDAISDGRDRAYITALRERLQTGTNAQGSPSASVGNPEQFPRLAEKMDAAQKRMAALAVFADSPDKEEAAAAAQTDAVLYTTQLAEWALFYILTDGGTAYRAREALARFAPFREDVNSGHIIGGLAAKEARACGFELDEASATGLRERYGRLSDALEKTPALIALLDLAVCTLRAEPWFTAFASGHRGFVLRLLALNRARNASFHSGEAGMELGELRTVYEEVCALLAAGLGVSRSADGRLSFAEQTAVQNERNAALARMEEALGFTLCHTLDATLLRFFTDMERRAPDAAHVDNAVVLDQYRILESVFDLVNESLGDEWKQSNWIQKAQAAGFALDGSAAYGPLLCTKESFVQDELMRRHRSMNAACIAFVTLADNSLLRALSHVWQTLLADVSYVTGLRVHGEIPDCIDAARVWEIKNHVTALIVFFAHRGFLARKTVN